MTVHGRYYNEPYGREYLSHQGMRIAETDIDCSSCSKFKFCQNEINHKITMIVKELIRVN